MQKIGKYILPIFFVLMGTTLFGQKNEVGLSLGGFNYTGELAPRFNFKNYRPAGSLFYRHNFSPVVAIRVAGTVGKLHGDDNYSDFPVNATRGASFSSYISEFSLLFEYNFFNYRGRREDKRFCPYVATGIAIANNRITKGTVSDKYDKTIMCVPIGMGIKYKLGRQSNLGFEFVARKTFTDKVDGVGNSIINHRETANIIDKDFYYYTGITWSYTFYSVVCPQHFQNK